MVHHDAHLRSLVAHDLRKKVPVAKRKAKAFARTVKGGYSAKGFDLNGSPGSLV